jgi:hypothetical protein
LNICLFCQKPLEKTADKFGGHLACENCIKKSKETCLCKECDGSRGCLCARCWAVSFCKVAWKAQGEKCRQNFIYRDSLIKKLLTRKIIEQKRTLLGPGYRLKKSAADYFFNKLEDKDKALLSFSGICDHFGIPLEKARVAIKEAWDAKNGI